MYIYVHIINIIFCDFICLKIKRIKELKEMIILLVLHIFIVYYESCILEVHIYANAFINIKKSHYLFAGQTLKFYKNEITNE